MGLTKLQLKARRYRLLSLNHNQGNQQMQKEQVQQLGGWGEA